MQQTDSVFALPAKYPAITPFSEPVRSPLLIAAIHDKFYNPQLPPLTDSSWDDVYIRNAKKDSSYASALENLGDAILRWVLAQVARKTIPTLTAEGTTVSRHGYYLSKLRVSSAPQPSNQQQRGFRKHCTAAPFAQECERKRRSQAWDSGERSPPPDETICGLV